MKISIGIPAYNVEKYIESCLTSVVKQDLSFDEYEIIVVNDGSTDSTHSKIIDFAKNYPNFVVIDKENEGLSAARNLCIDKASGEYIIFLDSDDTIIENCLGSIYDHMKSDNLDILEYDFICVDEQRKPITRLLYTADVFKRPINKIMSGHEYLLSYGDFIPMVQMRAYRRDFLIKHKLYMINKLHEDENFTPRVYYFAKRVKNVNTVIYNYMQRSNSIMGSYGTKNLFDMIDSMGLLKEFAYSNIKEEEHEIKEFIEKRIIKILNLIYLKSIVNNYNVNKELVRKMRKYHIYPFDSKQKKKVKLFFDYSAAIFYLYYKNKLRKMHSKK